jgi:hypothetical protein
MKTMEPITKKEGVLSGCITLFVVLALLLLPSFHLGKMRDAMATMAVCFAGAIGLVAILRKHRALQAMIILAIVMGVLCATIAFRLTHRHF